MADAHMYQARNEKTDAPRPAASWWPRMAVLIVRALFQLLLRSEPAGVVKRWRWLTNIL